MIGKRDKSPQMNIFKVALVLFKEIVFKFNYKTAYPAA